MKRCLVYFLTTIGREPMESVKIGCCNGNLHNRISLINVHCPDNCELLGVIVCKDKKEMLTTERVLHKQFEAFWVKGEWYLLASEITDYIQAFTESGQDILEEGHQKILERYHNDPKYRERRKEKYHNDPEYQKRERKKARERYHNDPKYRERQKEKARERYHNNPEYHREYNRRPEVKAKSRERSRKAYAKKRKKRPVSEHTLSIPGM